MTVYKKMLFAVFVFAFLACAVALTEKNKSLEVNEEGKSFIKRNSCGEGKRQVEMEAKIADTRERVTVTVGERQYSEEALPQIFEEAVPVLEKAILGKNKSLDEVRSDLKLITKIPKTGIYVSWRPEDYELMDLSGKLKEEGLKEEGSLMKLQAILSANDKEAAHTFYVHVFPPLRPSGREKAERLMKTVKQIDEDTNKEPYLILPTEIDGEAVKWYYPKTSGAAGLLLLGFVAAAGMWIEEKQQKKRRAKEKANQMEVDYSQIISQLTLFLKAGMTMHAAWVKIARSYEYKKSIAGARFAYDEIVHSIHEMEQGVSEDECYERFGSRCALASYRKLGSLLSQNLRKGTKGLAELLKKESADAFEERKNRAKRIGEEASTKLLGPMFCMLAVVIMIIVVPAFLTIQI